MVKKPSHRGDRIRLTKEERRRLQEIAKSGQDLPRTRSRAMVVLLSDVGESQRRIGRVLGITGRTVCETRRRWRREAFKGLADAPRSGRPPRADAKYIREMIRVVQKDPRALGYAFARWTAPRLAAYLAEKTGVEVSAAWLGELLRTHGFVWHKTKRTLANLQDPAAMERARRRMGRLKRGSADRPQPMSCGSGTA